MLKNNRNFFGFIIDKIFSYNQFAVILISTLISTLLSIPLVYLFVSLFALEYKAVFFYLSIILPSLITPLMVYFILKLVKDLKFMQDHLENEINKNKKKDIMLFEQARFVLMGEMMANISHQWKQPLNTVSLAVVAIRLSNCSQDELDRYFTIMEDNINYLSSTVDDFMSFFDERVSSESRDLKELIREVRSIVHTSLDSKKIILDVSVDKNTQDIKMVSSITQVLLNLLNNSRDALQDIDIQSKIELNFIGKDDGLLIECCDNGNGIDADIKDKIFDPYFTTKHKGKGTGIGLFMSKEIVQKVFGGDIFVKSSNKLGTCFSVFVPYSNSCINESMSYPL